MYYLINKQGTYRFDETAIRSIVSNAFPQHDKETGRITLRHSTVFTYQDGTKQSYEGPLSDFYLARHFIELCSTEEPCNA